MATILKSVRVRGDRKPKEEGGLDGRLTLSIENKDRRVIVYFTNTETLYDSEFAGGVFRKKDHGEKTDDEVIKLYLNHYPKWSIIQDPFDPNVIPPDNSFKKPSNGINYTADTTISQESSFITRQDIKPKVDSGELSTKSYTFILKNPKNDDEKKVKLIIWIVDVDASPFVKNDKDWLKTFAGTQIIGNDLVPYPTAGNYYAISKLINAPKVSPKDGKPTNLEKAGEEFSPAGVSFLSLLAAKKESSTYKGTLNNVNDYIDYIIWNQKYTYQSNVYNVIFSSDADLPKFDLPENSVEFIQSAQASQEEVKPDPVAESTTAPTETIKPLFAPDKIFTFNVEKSGIIINPEIGTFSIVDMTPEFQFSNAYEDEISVDLILDPEYIESGYIGLEQEPDLVFYKETQSTEGAVEDTSSGGEVAPGGQGALTFDGKKFLPPEVDKKYSTTYVMYIDYTKMPKPKLTKQGLIDTKLKVEGGLTGNPSDSAAKKGYCPTLKNGKKYHTNKGVTYAVWKNIFGTTNDARFLDMSFKDWLKVFDTLFWNVNATSKYESVNCLLTSFAWGGNKPKTVNNAKKLLNVSNLDSVSEERAVAALLSARAQFFINISQPGVENNVFRKGWINGVNKFINETYF